MRIATATVLTIATVLTAAAFGRGSQQVHPDYVPDEKTAERIAEAVLVGQFGEERVKSQLPLRAHSIRKDVWMVTAAGGRLDKEGNPKIGGGFGVWIKKSDGCLSVIEHMK